MNVSEFDWLMGRLEATFGQSIKDPVKVITWEKCKNIPSRLVKAIASRLEDQDSLPRNLSRAVLACWYALDNTATNQERKGCPECVGGAIYVKRDGETFAFQCATCHPTGEHRATQAQLRAAEFVIDNPGRSGNQASPEAARVWIERIQARTGIAVSMNSAGEQGRRLDPREAARRAELEERRAA